MRSAETGRLKKDERKEDRAFLRARGPSSGAYCRAGMDVVGELRIEVAAFARMRVGRRVGDGQPGWEVSLDRTY